MALVDSKIAAAFEARAVGDDALRDAIGGALGEIRAQVRKEFADELTKLDLKFSGLLHEVSLKQTVESAQRERDAVIDLPVLPLRSQRRS